MIILLGKPGAGKGTQAELLERENGYVAVSTGEVLRDAAKFDSRLAEVLNSGQLADSQLIFQLLEQKFQQVGKNRIILDNFPRNQEQASWLIKHLEKKPPEKIDLVILNISDEEVSKRLNKRGRADDNPEGISKRLQIFHNDVRRAVALLKGVVQQKEVNGEGTVNEVHQRILKALEMV